MGQHLPVSLQERNTMHRIAAVVVGLSLAFVGTSATIAATINVPGDYALIQDAIDASSDGDVIDIAAGTYYETGLDLLGKLITVRGQLDAGGTPLSVIDGQGAAQALMGCYSGESISTVIANLHFTNGGGLFFYLNSSATVNNCLFTNNYNSIYGGATTAYAGCSPSYNDCTFRNNEAARFGGAVLSTYNCYPTFTRCIFEENHAGKGGGAVASYQSSAYFGCIIRDNTTDGGGGGIYTTTNLEYLMDTLVCGNSPTQIGGSWTDNGGNCVQDSCDDCDESCPGDFDDSGTVDVSDLLAVIAGWDDPYNVNDLLLVISEWGSTCP